MRMCINIYMYIITCIIHVCTTRIKLNQTFHAFSDIRTFFSACDVDVKALLVEY